ncbi:MAG: Rieske 2Fe-2S domain-containing protein [Caldilineaceae bacterium]|nr:Rieske 2Fe-2S domain-containing protein [Caldilineaceae bacterium]
MAENLENLSGADRIAALKAKMQASAQARAAEADDEAAPEAVATPEVANTEAAAAAASPAAAPAAEAVAVDAGDAETDTSPADAADEVVAEADAAAETAVDADEEAPAEAVESANGTASNGASAGAPVGPPPVLQGVPEESPETALQREYSRREFLTYAWGAATALVLAETGLGMYVFMYPRFKAGEFGGKFFVDEALWPANADAPQGNPDGKFWMVEVEDGSKKALYMVCPHLGCLYKWEPANWRFECPCHGSKYTHDGFYIEGPAPRSLDSFVLSEADGEVVVDTGKKVTGSPASESPARRIIA